MKNFTFLFLLLLGFTGFTQQKQNPEVYLNSVKIDFNKVYINEYRIDSVKVDKKPINGAIYILTKGKQFSYLTLTDILAKYTDIKSDESSILFQIKGKFLEDISGIEIDDTYFIYVDVKDLSGAMYLKDKFRDMKIVSIQLENAERRPEIRIRGNKNILLKENIN